MSYGLIPKIQGGGSGAGPQDCGTVTSSVVPPGVTNAAGAGYDPSNKLLCDVSDPTAALCNTTGNPAYCFFAKKNGQKLLGRGTEADLAAWIAFTPGGQVVPTSYTPGGATGGGAPSDGIPTWALALGGVAVLGVVGFFVLRK